MGRALNTDIENCALIVFNIYKTLAKKPYLMETWNDLYSHLKSISHEAIKEEIQYVETNCEKFTDVAKLSKKYQYKKDPKIELLHAILTNHFGDKFIKQTGNLKPKDEVPKMKDLIK